MSPTIMSAPSVAIGPATPPHRLAELARSPYAAIRLRVAEHPGTPTATLRALADDGQALVSAAAAKRLG